MNASKMKIREFPALFMTALIAVASLTTTASLRTLAQPTVTPQLSRQTLSSAIGASDAIHDYKLGT